MTRKAKQGDTRSENGSIEVYQEAIGRFVPIAEITGYRDRQRRIRQANRGNVEVANWRDADNTLIVRLVLAVTRLGFAVQFGYTRDGGAFAVRIVGDGEPFTEFVRPTEDIDLFLAGFCSDYESAPDNDFAAARHV